MKTNDSFLLLIIAVVLLVIAYVHSKSTQQLTAYSGGVLDPVYGMFPSSLPHTSVY